MSLYLFVLVMDLFSQIMARAVHDGDYKLHHRCKNPVITHISFTDDLIAFMNKDIDTMSNLLKCSRF